VGRPSAAVRGFHQAGDPDRHGRTGGCGQCDPEAAVQWLAQYCNAVTLEFESREWMRPPFSPLWRAMSIALRVRLLRGEVKDFEAARPE
jgi:hypothetical protein